MNPESVVRSKFSELLCHAVSCSFLFIVAVFLAKSSQFKKCHVYLCRDPACDFHRWSAKRTPLRKCQLGRNLRMRNALTRAGSSFRKPCYGSLSCVRLFVTPWAAARQASLPPLSPGVCSNPCPLSRWCHPTILSSVTPFSVCPQSSPASRSFLMS